MLNKFKFLYLLLMSLVTLSHATEIGCGYHILPKYGAPIGEPMYKEDDFYTYKLAFDRQNELYMYMFNKSGLSMQVRHYVRLHNNYEITHHTGLSTQVFYRFACNLTHPTLIYPLKKFDVNNDPKINTAKYIVDVYAVDTDFSVQYCKLGYDLANHKCADDCEHITDKELRFDCACKKKFPDSKYTGIFSSDPNVCKTPDISFTPKCCFSCGNGKTIVVNAANEYAEYRCFYDEIDHLHLENPKKPDDNKTKPDKPDKPNPDKPNPGGGGGKPGGGGSKPDKPGDDDKGKDKNNTHPDGGGGGGKPGDKDDKNNPNMDFSGYDKLTKDIEKGVGKVMGMYDDAKKQLMGTYDKIKKGSLHDFKHRGFVGSCPYTRDFVIKDGLTKKITVDICAVVKDARPVLYFIFNAAFSTIFSILLFKIIIRLV